MEPLDDAREELLERLQRGLETPMLVLGFVWLCLLVLELVRGLTPGLELLMRLIWIAFVADFLVALAVAPRKLVYLKRNWLTVVSLVLPALRVVRVVRVVRVLRVARAARGLSLVRLVTSANRGMRALGRTMQRRGFGYVVAVTLLVAVLGAAGMYAFERRGDGGVGLDGYASALWWTAMLMTTMGSEYWPRTPEGRILCFLLALYAFAVFGYVTAALASFFVGRDATAHEVDDADADRDVEPGPGPTPDVASTLAALRDEVAALRDEIRALRETRDAR